MSLKVKLTPVVHYKVEVAGLELGEFSVDSQWEGMASLKNSKGEQVIVDLAPRVNFISLLFGEPAVQNGSLVKASPGTSAAVHEFMLAAGAACGSGSR